MCFAEDCPITLKLAPDRVVRVQKRYSKKSYLVRDIEYACVCYTTLCEFTTTSTHQIVHVGPGEHIRPHVGVLVKQCVQ